jgi:hypothetical protein
MKKLLSLLLALAIVISCVSMVTFNASAEDEAAPTVTDEFLGWKMTAVSDLLTGTPYMVTSSAGNVFTKDDIDEDGSITRSFTVINDNNYDLALTISFQGKLKWPSGTDYTWAKPNSNAERAFTVSAKSSETISIKLDTIDEEGNVTFTRSGSTETAVLPVTQIFFRIDFGCDSCDFYNGDSIVVLTNGLLEDLTPTDNSNNAKLVAEKFYESSYDSLDYLTAENGDAEKGDTSFWSSTNAGSVTNIPESDVTNNPEDTNRVIKFTPTEDIYSSIFYDYSRTIHLDRVNLLNGGPGTYQLSFRYRVVNPENANKGSFKVYFASKNSIGAGDVKKMLGENTYTAATYSFFNCERIVMTEKWAYYTGTFTLTEDYYNMFFKLKAKNVKDATIFGIRICGADSAFKDGTYEYLFDDLEFKKVDDTKPVGVHYFVNSTSLNDKSYLYTHQNAKFTADDVVTDANGKLYIPVRYTVYNYNNFPFTLSIYIQNFWSDVSGLKTSKEIPARQAAEIGFNIPVVKIGDTYYYTSSENKTTGNKILKGAIYEPIENANLRVDTGNAAYPAGAGVIVATSDTNDPIYSGISESQKYKDMNLLGSTGAGRAAFIYDLPDLEVTSTILDHSTDYYIARKITVTQTGSEHYYNTPTKNLFAIDQNNQQFTGTKTISYTVHNTSRKPLHISLQFQAEEGGEWTGGDAKDEQTILPGCKATLTTSLAFTNGNATMTVGETTKDVSLLDIFAHFSFYFVNESVGDTFYIESNAIYDPILNAPSGTANISCLSVKDFTKCDNTTAKYLGVKVSLNEAKEKGYDYLVRTPANLSSDDKNDEGYIVNSYTVHNDSSVAISLRFEYQTGDAEGRIGWDNPVDKGYTDSATINAYSSHTFTIKLKVEDDGTVKFSTPIGKDENGNTTYGERSCDISNTYFRITLQTPATDGPATFYIVPNNTNALTEALSRVSSSFSGGNDKAPVLSSEIIQLYNTLDEEVDFGGENKIIAANVQIGSSLTVNYVVSKLNRFTTVPTLRITRGDDVRIIDGTLITDGEYAGKYLFAYTGVNAQCMADNIKAELIFDNTVLDTKDDYSVKKYAENLYNKEGSSEALKTLLADMLHYGAAVQQHIGYKTDDLATKGIDWTVSTYDKPEGVKTATQHDTDNKVVAVGLNISNVNKIYFRVTLKDEVTFSLTRNGNKADFVTDGDLIYTEAINATGFDDVFVLTITKDGEVISTVSYNLNAYINSKFDSEKLGNIIPALNNYGLSAKAYASLIQQ